MNNGSDESSKKLSLHARFEVGCQRCTTPVINSNMELADWQRAPDARKPEFMWPRRVGGAIRPASRRFAEYNGCGQFANAPHRMISRRLSSIERCQALAGPSRSSKWY